jgi:hypothetical protein
VRMRMTYAEKSSRYVSAEQEEKWKVGNVDHDEDWKYCDRVVDGLRSNQ